jgi:acyl dehydratase
MTLLTRGAPVGLHVKPSGTAAVSRLETRDAASGEAVNEQYCVTFFRGVTGGESRGEQAPDHRTPGARPDTAAAAATQHFDDDQTFRYSKASGDLMPFHLDADVARSVGLPGIIIHGLCTMAFTSWAAVENLAGGDSRRLRRLAVRFSRPVLPGDDVTTTFWSTGTAAGVHTYSYESRNPAGKAVIKDGLTEVAS